jgi:toxin secretion/phage lysis holin
MKVDHTKIRYGEVFCMFNLKNVFEAILDNWVVKGFGAVLLSVKEFLFCPAETNLVAIMILMVSIDTLTGLMKAVRNHTASSAGFFRFSLKLLVYFILASSSALMDKVLPISGYISALSTVIVYLCLTEFLSILENISALGYGVPTKIISVLKLTKSTLEEPVPPEKGDVIKPKEKEHV